MLLKAKSFCNTIFFSQVCDLHRRHLHQNMVQRKVPTKLALQGDHVQKVEILFDVKNNRGKSDLKKKMKKSGSTTLKKHVNQPGNPAAVAQTGLAQGKPGSFEKQSPVSKIVAIPNYMKSTTSFEARREKSYPQVSLTNPCISSVRRRSSDNGKHALESGMKSAKTLSRTSSWEKMRALTKNPSFKPVRASTRKSSSLVLCENLEVQRATCSSTLKDCKFPPYLSLNPGGTELEGTSAIKVCPYTYCSLNGHHHDPLPPLKNFLSARRRVIKTQRCIMQRCSPVHPAPLRDDPSSVENLLMQDNVKSSSAAATEEENNGYFIEICMNDEDCAGEDQGQILEGSIIYFGVEAEDTFSQSGDAEEEEEVPPPLLVQGEGKDGILRDVPGESMWEVQLSEFNSEVSDQTRDLTPQNLDYGFERLSMTEMEYDHEAYKIDEEIIYDELVINQEDIGGSSDESFENEVSQESFDEEGFKPDEFSSSNDVDYDYWQVLNNTKTSEPVGCAVQDPEPDPDELTSFAKALSDEGHTSNGENQNSSEETFESADSTNPVKEPPLEDVQLECSETEKLEVPKAENAAKPETENSSRAQVTTKCKKPINNEDELGLFNPRDPNFLPLETDPEAEKVDLRHQELDERKNSEEWMVDYALRQVVTKLGPARKRKVSLLVEAFEKVMPVAKFDLHLRHSSAFDHARPMQACS